MPYPKNLNDWITEDTTNLKVFTALMLGAADYSSGLHLGEAGSLRGYEARTAEGDAYETGWEFSEQPWGGKIEKKIKTVPIGELAARYVIRRRVKMNLKKKRNELMKQCKRVEDAGADGIRPCFFSYTEYGDAERRCEKCEEADSVHKQFLKMNGEATGALNALRLAVEKKERSG